MATMSRAKRMGETIARLGFRKDRDGEPVILELLVDTGSTYSWIDARVLKALGITRARKRRFETITGRRVTRDLGDAYVDYRGEYAPTAVVFATPRDGQVLGLHALESLGLAVDPASGRLRRSRYLLAM